MELYIFFFVSSDAGMIEYIEIHLFFKVIMACITINLVQVKPDRTDVCFQNSSSIPWIHSTRNINRDASIRNSVATLQMIKPRDTSFFGEIQELHKSTLRSVSQTGTNVILTTAVDTMKDGFVQAQGFAFKLRNSSFPGHVCS